MDDYDELWTMTAQYYKKDGWADPSKFWSGKFSGFVFHYPNMARMACEKAGLEMSVRNVMYDWHSFQVNPWDVDCMMRDLFDRKPEKCAEHRLNVCEGGWVIFRIEKD